MEVELTADGDAIMRPEPADVVVPIQAGVRP
jgi:hypothetical protein